MFIAPINVHLDQTQAKSRTQAPGPGGSEKPYCNNIQKAIANKLQRQRKKNHPWTKEAGQNAQFVPISDPYPP